MRESVQTLGGIKLQHLHVLTQQQLLVVQSNATQLNQYTKLY